MNTKIKLALLAGKYQEKGFTTALALGLGLVAVAVGLTMVAKGQANQNSAVAQKFTTQATAIAEAGATQYMSFLNNNRGLIAYDHDKWVTAATGTASSSSTSSSNSTGKLTVISSTEGADTTKKTSCPSSGSTSPSTSSVTISATLNEIQDKATTSGGANGGWKDLIDAKGEKAGQYRLVSYKGSGIGANGKATLIVEGKPKIGEAKARMQFEIGVTANTTSATGGSTTTTGGGFPGLWAEDFGSFKGASLIYANVWDSSAKNNTNPFDGVDSVSCVPDLPVQLQTGVDPEPQANNGNKELYTLSSTRGTITKTSDGLPALPNAGVYPTTSTPQLVYGPSTTTTGTVTENSLDCAALNQVTKTETTTVTTTNPKNGKTTTTTTTKTVPAPAFPRSTDKTSTNVVATSAPDNATYVYRCSGKLATANAGKILLGSKGEQTLIFYVPDMIEAGSDANLLPYQDPSTGKFTRSVFYVKKNVKFNAKGNVGDMRDPSAIQIYSYQVSPAADDFEMKGNSSFYGFLFAPGGKLSGTGTSDTAGAIWIKSISGAGNTKIWQGIMDPQRLMVTVPTLPTSGDVTTYQLDGAPSSVQRVEIK